MPSWEYLLVEAEKNTHSGEWEIGPDSGQPLADTDRILVLQDYLNKAGKNEWELVSDSVVGTRRELIFKRSKR